MPMRRLLKTIIYRVSSLIIGFIITYLILGELVLSIKLVVIINIVLMTWYYIYDGLWKQ